MAASMKKCKECGKLFVPKGRENYCSDVHYRPCPICGKPVEVKYFSDPPRKCEDCKYRKVRPLPAAMSTKSKSLFNVIPEDNEPSGLAQLKAEIEFSDNVSDGVVEAGWMDQVETTAPTTIDSVQFCEHVTGSVMVFIGKPHKNSFQPGHQYLLKVERSDYVYNVSSVEDVTSGESCDIIRPFASQISFYQNFGKIRKHSAGKGHTY